jgi:hypothetical protein
MNRPQITGQRLTAEQLDYLRESRESHLTLEQRSQINRLRTELEDKLAALRKAEQSYVRASSDGDRARIKQTNQRLMIAKNAHRSAAVTYAACLRACGLSD